MFLNRLPFVALLFACLLSSFISLFQKWSFFSIHLVWFTYVNTISLLAWYMLMTVRRLYVCVCLRLVVCVWLCVEEFCCRWKLNNHLAVHTTVTHNDNIVYFTLYRSTHEKIHTCTQAYSHTHASKRSLAVRLLSSFFRFVRFHCANRFTTTCTQTSERVNEWTNERMCPYARECMCTVCSFYCCQFACPFHLLVIRINNICALRSKYIIIYIMITFARCWCAWALYVRMCVRRFFSQYSLILIPFHIYIPVDITCGSGFTFRYSFSLFQAVNHSIG